VDIPGRALHRWNGSQHRRWELPTEPGCIAPRLCGGLLMAMRDGLWAFDTASGRRERLADAPYDTAVQRFNDGKADAQGRFWAGTIHEPRDTPRAALYRWADGTLERVAGEATVGNGLAFSPDGRTLYWADTPAHRVDAFDLDAAGGTLSRRRPFAQFAPRAEGAEGAERAERAEGAPLDRYGGRPDGAAVDVEGAYWVAMFEGARLVRLAADGTPLAELRLPVRCPTMPCFGGVDLRTLYVTSARDKRPEAELAAMPLSGCVLTLRVAVPGLPVNFAK
jgi:sugar lactone lactonase YvrE